MSKKVKQKRLKMEKAIFDYLNNYEKSLLSEVLKYLTSLGHLDGKLLETEDINEVWEKVAPSYVADSIKEIAKYPNVALGWAMYVGMAVARFWDEDWNRYSSKENLYEYLRDKRGYDYLDEVVRGDVLSLDGELFEQIEELVRRTSSMVLSHIRHEQIEPQSPMAFHVFARSIRVLYKIGAAVELKNLGYKFERCS